LIYRFAFSTCRLVRQVKQFTAGQDHLQSDDAIHLDLPRLVHHAHAAATQLAE
jgi:hypothetical protein